MGLDILIVEDDPNTLRLIDELLEPYKANVSRAADFHQAGLLVALQKYDGVIQELILGGREGFDLIRKIRKSSWNKVTPVMVLTRMADKGAMEKAFQAGATFFLTKPVDKTSLQRLISSSHGMMLEERRRFHRIPLHSEVTCRTNYGEFKGQANNLSIGGMRIVRSGASVHGEGQALKPPTRLAVTFRLEINKPPIEATADVVWMDNQRHIGLRFTELKDQDRQRIRERVIKHMEAHESR